METNILSNDYTSLLNQISETYNHGRKKAIMAVNTNMVETYWKIGQYIVEFEQGGQVKAQYGLGLLERLSKDLSIEHGKGFGLSNLKRMRQFYITYQIGATLSHQLGWSHIVKI